MVIKNLKILFFTIQFFKFNIFLNNFFQNELFFLTCVSVATRPHVISGKELLETSYKHYSIQLKTDKGRYGGTFSVGLISNRGKRFKFFLDMNGELPPKVPPIMRSLDLPIKKTLRSELGLVTEMILKRVNESIFFQNNKFAVFKVKNGKQVAGTLIVFNLLKIIYPF